MSDIPKLVADLRRIRLHGGNFDEANRDSKVIADAVQALEQMAKDIEIYEAAIARLRKAVEALDMLAAQDSGKPGSTARADCMAIMAKAALREIGEIPE